MKLHELFDDDLDEGLARWAGIAGLGAAAVLGQPSQPAPGTVDSVPATTMTQPSVAAPAGAVSRIVRPAVVKPSATVTQSSVGTATQADPARQNFLRAFASKSGLRGDELAAFLAQTAHETGGFRNLQELGDSDYFQRLYDRTGNPSKAAQLGNVNVGDGELYKGRGFMHLTGRDNYRRAGAALGMPLEQHPEMAARPGPAAKIAMWFWKNRVKPNVSNWADVRGVTQHINPGMQGLSDRVANFHHYRKVLPVNKKKK